MRSLKINTKAKSNTYDIFVGKNLILDGKKYFKNFIREGIKVVLISDKNVFNIYGKTLIDSLKTFNCDIKKIIISPGESSKTLKSLVKIYDEFLKFNLRRDDLIISFGGGVVGDMSGLLAGTWMRGIKYIQIPTTLLSQVDSSVGGKTAVDIPKGKNMVGIFYHPSLVLIDTNFLKTLPVREFSSGMAEVIKYALISSGKLFNKLEKLSIDFSNDLSTKIPKNFKENYKNEVLPGNIILECLKIKGEIVYEDELDNGKRKLLNFGHTFGHAIETRGNFKKWTHGEAIFQGMIIASAIGEILGLTKNNTTNNLLMLSKKFNLPIPLKISNEKNLKSNFVKNSKKNLNSKKSSEKNLLEKNLKDLIRYIKSDKKASTDEVSIILLEKIGSAFILKIKFSKLESLLVKAEKMIVTLISEDAKSSVSQSKKLTSSNKTNQKKIVKKLNPTSDSESKKQKDKNTINYVKTKQIKSDIEKKKR